MALTAGPSRPGLPAEGPADPRAGWPLRIVALLAMAPALAALGWAVSDGDGVVAAAVAVALAVGVIAGVLLELDDVFDRLPGFAVALLLSMTVVGLAGIAERLSTVLVLLVIVAGAFVWGLDWSRPGRLRTQTFLLLVPVWFALFSDDSRAAAGAAVLGLLIVAALVLSSADELGALPRLSMAPRAHPAQTRRGADLAAAAAVACAAAVLGLLLLGDRSLAPPADEIADRLPFGETRAEQVGPGSGSGSGSGGSGSGGAPGVVPAEPGAGSGEAFVVPEVGESPGGGTVELPDVEGSESADGEGSDGDGSGLGVGGSGTGGGFEGGGFDPFTGEPLPDGAADEPTAPEITPELIAAVVLALAAAALLAWWWRTRDRTPRPEVAWADALARRLAREGARRGRPRAAAETLLAYTEVLSEEALPDDRLLRVGAILSSALFGPEPPTGDEQSWAETTVDEIVAAHPAPGLVATARSRLTP